MKFILLLIFLFSGISHAAPPDPYFCMKGFFYAEEGRPEDLLQFLKEDQKTVPSCQESFRYKGLLLPHYIIEKKYEKVYSALIEGVGANWEAYYGGNGDDTVTLLHLAIATKQNLLIDLLLNKGANVNRRFTIFYPNKVPLQVAMEDWQDEGFALKFIDKNLDVSIWFSNKDGIKYSPAMTALNLGWKQTLKALLDKGLDPNTKSPVVDKSGYVSISQSIPLVVGTVLRDFYNKLPLLQILLDAGADINACSVKEYGSKETVKYCALNMVAGYLTPKSTVDDPAYLWLKFVSKYKIFWGNLSTEYNDNRSPIELAVSKVESLSELKLLVGLGFPIGPDKNTITNYEDFTFNLTRVAHDGPTQWAYAGYILVDNGWFEALKAKGQSKNFHSAVFNYMLEGVADNDLITQIKNFLNMADPQYAYSETVDSALRVLFGKHDPSYKTIAWAESAGYDFKSHVNDLLEKERKGDETILGLLNDSGFRIDYIAATSMKLGYFQLSDKELVDILTLAFHEFIDGNFNAAAELAAGKNITIVIDVGNLHYISSEATLAISRLFENPESVKIIMRSIEKQDEVGANWLVSRILKKPIDVTSTLQNNLLLLYAGLSSAAFLPDWPEVNLDGPSPNDGKASLCAKAIREGHYPYINKYCEQPIKDLINE